MTNHVKFHPLLISMAGLAALALPVTTTSASRMIKIGSDGSIQDVTPQSGKKTQTSQSQSDTSLGYVPTLNPTYTDAQIAWGGRNWRVNAAATKYPSLPHSLEHSSKWQKLRFEVRADDPPMEDKVEKRRSELSGSVYGDATRLPNGVSLWGAFSTLQHPWADPAGMRASTYGAVYGQIHMGSKVGGSPALAFRRKQDGTFRITTRGEFDNAGTERYAAALSFGAVHDIVYNVVLHPTNGKLKVWLDGRLVVDVPKASIGHSAGDSFWNVGIYAPGGVTSPVVAEVANHVYPGTSTLLARASAAPAWPTD